MWDELLVPLAKGASNLWFDRWGKVTPSSTGGTSLPARRCGLAAVAAQAQRATAEKKEDLILRDVGSDGGGDRDTEAQVERGKER